MSRHLHALTTFALLLLSTTLLRSQPSATHPDQPHSDKDITRATLIEELAPTTEPDLPQSHNGTKETMHGHPIRQYYLHVTPADSLTLYTRNVWSKAYLGPARFEYNGEVFAEVSFRFRGHCYGRGGCDGTRPNKSFKIKFPKSHKLDGTIRNLNLNVIWQYTDQQGGLFRSKLPMELFALAGYPSPRTRWCEFYLNGRYMGLFMEQQELDSGPFLDDWFGDDNGTLYRFDKVSVDSAGHTRFWREINVEDNVDWSDFTRFMLAIEERNEHEFWNDIEMIVDIPSFLDHAALNMLCSVSDLYNYGHKSDWDTLRTHEVLENPAMYHEPSSDRFVIVPWDANAALSHIEVNPLPEPWTKEHILGYIIAKPEWREIYKARLRHYLETIFAESNMFAMIDKIYGDTAGPMGRHNERWRGEYGSYDVEKEREEVRGFIQGRRGFVVASLFAEDGYSSDDWLSQNYPNPFGKSTAIRCWVGNVSMVSVEIYTVSGQHVRSLVGEAQGPGVYETMWDGRNDAGICMPCGVYIGELVAGDRACDVIKMMYVK